MYYRVRIITEVSDEPGFAGTEVRSALIISTPSPREAEYYFTRALLLALTDDDCESCDE